MNFRRVLILFIIVITIAARFYNLGFQSLWFDELYSMTIAAPGQGFNDIMTDIRTDFHPPLYYLFLNFMFKFIPYNDLSGRILSAIMGCISIVLVYLLGREVRGRRTGILMALFFSVFFYHIKYSQETRMYIFLFALVVISSLLFLKYLKDRRQVYLIFYVVVSVVTIYTQYYGFFIMMAHGMCLLHLWITKVIDFKVLRNFIFAYLSVIVLYLPWIPRIFQTGGRQHFIELPAPWYFFDYLYEYTGKEPVTALFILTGLALFVVTAVRKIKQKRFQVSAGQLLIVYSVIAIFVLTWIVSIFKPMLSKHSTLAGLPFLLLMVFTGYERLKERKLWIVLGVVVVANITNLLFISRYYTKNFKDNFRQITGIVLNDNRDETNLVVVSQLAGFYNYYFDQFLNGRTESGKEWRVLNPNEILPAALSPQTEIIIVMNAPFTEEKEKRLEPVNELGFQILNPRLLHKADSIDHYWKIWNSFIAENYLLDTLYNDPKRNIPIAFKFSKKNQ